MKTTTMTVTLGADLSALVLTGCGSTVTASETARTGSAPISGKLSTGDRKIAACPEYAQVVSEIE